MPERRASRRPPAARKILVRRILVLGGARSGKSHYAQHLAETSALSPVLVATATAGDAEMAARIARHRAARGPRWQTLEEPVALGGILGREARADRVLLVDCLTLWLTNILLAGADVGAETERLAALTPTLEGAVVFVSNEVGSGIVPDNSLARDFRDAQGRLNQAMAIACDSVVLVAAGLPRLLKPSDDPIPRL